MQKLIISDGSYLTPERKISFISRIFPSLNFYPRFMGVVLNAAGRAKRGDYPSADWQDDSHKIFMLLEDAGLKFSLEGLHNLEQLDGPCVFIGNHMSIMETLTLPTMILSYKKVTFVVKESLLRYPVFKHVMSSRNPVAVSRTNPRQDLKTVLTEGTERLQNGISIIVFPQTTRSTTFDSESFGSIGIKLAKKANVPIIPLALKTNAWMNGKYSKDFGRLVPERKVRFAFGEPLQISGKGTEEHQKIIDFIEKKLNEWK